MGDAHGSDVFIVAALCAISRSSSRHRYSQHSINTIDLYRRPFLSIASKQANQLNCRLPYTTSRESIMNQDAKPVRLVYPQEYRGPKRATDCSNFVLRTSNFSMMKIFCLGQHWLRVRGRAAIQSAKCSSHGGNGFRSSPHLSASTSSFPPWVISRAPSNRSKTRRRK